MISTPFQTREMSRSATLATQNDIGTYWNLFENLEK